MGGYKKPVVEQANTKNVHKKCKHKKPIIE